MTHVKPEDVKPIWPRVREALKKLEQYDPDWMPEDAYRGILNGTSFLSLIGDDGFMIWQRFPGDDGRGMLWVLALASFVDAPAFCMLKHYKEVNRELDELAAKMNCKRIRHISKHEAWEGRWKMLGHVFEREI